MQHLPFFVVGAVILSLGGCYAVSRPNAQTGASTGLLMIAPGESVRGPLRLNASTREQHIRRCESSEMVSDLDNAARYCDCLINRLEDRANKLEFALIMSAIVTTRPTGSLSRRLVPASEGRGPKYLREAAIADGFSNVDYTEVVLSVPPLAEAAARHCGS
jgi:hypothetical protein